MDLSLPPWLTDGFPELWAGWASPCAEKLGPKIFGIHLLWWGRAGKLLQFIGGMTIVLEIFGIDWVRYQADRFRANAPLRELWTTVRESWRALGRLWLFMLQHSDFSRGTNPIQEQKRRLEARTAAWATLNLDPYIRPVIVTTLVLEVVLITSEVRWGIPGVSRWPGVERHWVFFYLVVMTPCILFVLAPLTLAVGVALFSTLTSLLAWTFLFPAAWVLSRDKLERNAKAFALLMLIAGFLLDFLAS